MKLLSALVYAWAWGAATVTALAVLALPFILAWNAEWPVGRYIAGLGEAALLVGLCLCLAGPLALVLALILDQSAPRGADTGLLQGALNLLGGVPPVVHGIIALVLAGSSPPVWITAGVMTTLVLPGLVQAVRRAFLRARPSDRLTAVALGASPWEVLAFVVGPAAASDVLAGVLRASSRLLGLAGPFLVFRGSITPAAVTATRDALDGGLGLAAGQSLLLVAVALVLHATAARLVQSREDP